MIGPTARRSGRHLGEQQAERGADDDRDEEAEDAALEARPTASAQRAAPSLPGERRCHLERAGHHVVRRCAMTT